MTERASFEELLEFANKVRQAGGGDVIDALMPGTPTEPQSCLIAQNLNFSCSVDTLTHHEAEAQNQPDHTWCMWVSDPALADTVAKAMDLPRVSRGFEDDEGDESIYYNAHGVVLPPGIGQVAADFDAWGDLFIYNRAQYNRGRYIIEAKNIAEFRAFLPYLTAVYLSPFRGRVFSEDGESLL